MLQPDDLLTPAGRLNAAALWPTSGAAFPDGFDADAVEEKLQAFLNEGYAKAAGLSGADLDDAARAWSYHRAYQEVYERMLLMPSTVSVTDEGSSSYTQAQIDLMGVLAAQYLEEFDSATGADESYGVITSLR